MKKDSELLQDQLEYAIQHESVRFFVKRRWLIFHAVYNIEGTMVGIFLLKAFAEAHCSWYNAIHNLGYTRGQRSIINILL
jgi:hypothetical protein